MSQSGRELIPLINAGTSFYSLPLEPVRERPACIVTCRYCGNRYTDPPVMRCVDGCGAPLPEPSAALASLLLASLMR